MVKCRVTVQLYECDITALQEKNINVSRFVRETVNREIAREMGRKIKKIGFIEDGGLAVMWLISHGTSQAEIAEQCGVTPTAVHYWAHGDERPRDVYAERLWRMFKAKGMPETERFFRVER